MARHRLRAQERKHPPPQPSDVEVTPPRAAGLRHRVDVPAMFERGHLDRVDALQADWLDEAAEAAVAGNPRRAHYLEMMATQVPRLVREAIRG